MKNVSITLALALALALPLSLPAQVKRAEQSYAAAIEFSPISPLFDIYAVQYARNLGEGSELFAGLSYANVKYDHGRSHAPGLILGARRYMWNRFHIEYQLWPSYNWYYESDEQEYYRGPELWNEFRVGYTVDFAVSGQPLFINLQYLLGFGLYGGNKPESFQRQAQEEPLFLAPVLFLGWRFGPNNQAKPKLPAVTNFF